MTNHCPIWMALWPSISSPPVGVNPGFTKPDKAVNWKIWQFYEKNNQYAEVYNKLWEEADEYACNNLKGDEAAYFFWTTD